MGNLGEACSRCEAATVRSFVLALSALHLTHSDTPFGNVSTFAIGMFYFEKHF